MEKIRITVSPENFLNGDYESPENCPLALALKDKFPEQAINFLWVIRGAAVVNGKEYDFAKGHEKILKARAGEENQKPLKMVLIAENY